MVEKLSLIVKSDYVIVLFYHGMVHKPTWGWLKQAYGMLERKFFFFSFSFFFAFLFDN